MLPKNVDMKLVATIRESGWSPAECRRHATGLRHLGRQPNLLESTRKLFLVEAARYKRAAQYIERSGQ